MSDIRSVKPKGNVKLKGIRVYSDTLKDVQDYISSVSPRMTIVRFYDEAAKEKLKQIKNEEITRSVIGGTRDSESAQG